MEDGTETHQAEINKKIKANDKIAENPHEHARGTQDAYLRGEFQVENRSCLAGSQKAIPILAKSDRQTQKNYVERVSKEIEIETQETLGNPAKMDRPRCFGTAHGGWRN